ncbi:hypothetical protein BC952_1579 [Flavobacterium limicola]|uniref:Uncharacterized protein n=1 Tax=Flavobacterium limicola TaxID=180441 RepID=A0A495S3Q8_9FLAO|nr:hypothetical protein [Flavobacterium limicola]RKS93738.1 hypothetical protein BC952_1579 [Flavobacterium limicola]
MTTQDKVNTLVKIYSTFDKNILSKSLSRVRFVITTHQHETDNNTVKIKDTDEINDVITEFNEQVGLKPLGFVIEDARLLKSMGGYIIIQLLDINIVS